MKVFYNLFLLVCLVFLFSCAINQINEEKTVVTLNTGTEVNPIVISLMKGPQWAHKITPGPFIIHIYPQVVFWMEDDAGNLLKTLYITGADGKFTKHATKKKMDSEFFRKCFPIWSDKIIQANQKLPGSSNPYPDAVTSATPQSSFDVATQIGNIKVPFSIYAEINKTGDYNDYYTEDLTDWVGQPSILYSVSVNQINKNQSYELTPVGHSNIQQGEPVLMNDFENIDSALQMVDKIRVKF